MEITYCRYVENDFDDLKEMVFGLYGEDSMGMPMTENRIEMTARESICHPEKVQIIIFRNGETAVGYGILTFSWSNEYGGNVLDIDELYVIKEFRNRKVASGFIRYVLESHNDAALFTLRTTPSNKNSLKLFMKLGFKVSINTHLIQTAPHKV